MSRVARRAKKRLACALIVGRQRFSGVIIDLSSTGVFVQTTARPPVGEAVALELGIPGRKQTIRLQAQIVRLRVVPAQLLNLAQGGIGLRITNAPESYFEFLSEALPRLAPSGPDAPETTDREARGTVPLGSRSGRAAPQSAPRAPEPKPTGRAFRVRVRQIGGARSRTLRLRAATARDAAAAGLREVGAGWKVLETDEEVAE